MTNQVLIAENLRIAALLNNERVDQLIVAQGQHQIGDIYLGTVENVHPGIDAAFVKIGASERNGFIHVTDLGPLRLRQTAGSITELLEPRQKALVQVIKEPTGSKGPRLTGNVTLPGRFLVLQPSGRGVSISRRIHAEAERERLRALAVLIKPAGTGLLVRTSAEGVGEDQIIDDLEMLCRQWETIQATVETSPPPALLNRDDDFVHRTLRDHCGPDLDKIVVDGPQVAERVKAFLGPQQNTVAVEAFGSAEELLEVFRIDAAIQQALLPRVDLPSGGYVIIEPTEALTVIDVNSGSFTRSANARETVLWTNCEAATEIARQLQLRNIGGMVIVDFIDMDSRRDQLLLLEHFMKAMAPDKARPQIAQITELGLVELTRKRQGQNIYELFSQQCPTCAGQGYVVTPPGKVTPQPLTPGIAPLTPASTPAAAPGETRSDGNGSGNSRRRRRNSSRNGAPVTAQTPAPAPSTVAAVSGEPESVPPPEAPPTEAEATPPAEPETVVVPMTQDQETVFSWCGFNPALMASPPPKDLNNVAVRVVRSGEDTEPPGAEVKEREEPVVAKESPSRQRRQRRRVAPPAPAEPGAATTDQEQQPPGEASQGQEGHVTADRPRSRRPRSGKQKTTPAAAPAEASMAVPADPGLRGEAAGEPAALQGNGSVQKASAAPQDVSTGVSTEAQFQGGQDNGREQGRLRRRRSTT